MNPLTQIPEWSINDPSKIQSLITCPRRFFFEYILGWRLNMSNIHFVFGNSWHAAHEYLLTHDYSLDSVNEAHEAFKKIYFETYTEKDELRNSPKNSERAFLALCDYTGKYRKDLERFENIGVEISARVQVGRFTVVGRLDSINRWYDTKKYFSLDHKTGTSFGNFWTTQWDESIQAGIYHHILNEVYGSDNVDGLIFGGTFFHKVKDDSLSMLHEFHRYQMFKSPEQVHAIYLDVLEWLEFWDRQMNMMLSTSISDIHMQAFPRNCKSCASYGKMCPYKDFCGIWTNPLQHYLSKPLDFIIEHWNPLANDNENTKVVSV